MSHPRQQSETSPAEQMLALLSPATRAAVLERADQIAARESEHARLVAARKARESAARKARESGQSGR